MNTTKNTMIAWFKGAAVAALVLSCVFLLNTLNVSADTSSSSSSSSASSAASSNGDGSSAASAAAAASASASSGSNGSSASASAGAGASASGNGSSATATATASASTPGGAAFACSANGTQVTISWAGVANAAQYAYRVGVTANGWHSCSGAGELCQNTSATSATFNVVPGTAYSWWVHSVDAQGNFSAPNATQIVTCQAPVTHPPTPVAPVTPGNPNFTCSASGTQATISWSGVSNAAQYAYRVGVTANGWHSCSGAGELCQNTSATSATFNVVPGTAYSWWVHSVDAQGNFSSPTNPQIITCHAPTTPPPTQSVPPQPPTGLYGTCDSNNLVTIRWNGPTSGPTPTSYALRVDDTINGWAGSTDASGACTNVKAGDTCTNTLMGSPYTFVGTAGRTYDVWIHSMVNGTYSQLVGTTPVTCAAPVNPPQNNPLTGSCVANTSNAQIGDTVTWSATGIGGGNGNYTYAWNGDEGLSGNSSVVTRSYATSGSKNATLVITSNGQSITRNCSTYVQTPNQQPVYNQLGGTCYATQASGNVGDTITFNAQPYGGNGSYTYSWTGDEGLYSNSQSASRSYSYTGTKNATVTIYSNGQSITRTCSTQINQQQQYYNPQYNTLNASCVANQTSAYTGDNVSWSATGVTGGNGNYTYSWSGTDGLYGNSYYANMAYNNAGTKFAYLTVYSDGQSITRTCSLYVNPRYNTGGIVYTNPQYPYQPPYNSVSLTQVPYTGLESNMKVILFTLALIMWSAIVTYVVILRKRSNKLATATVSAATLGSVGGSDEAQQSARQEILMGHDNMLSNLESFARSQNVIVSGDALAAIADIAGNNQKKAETLLSSLANRHATGGEWTTLDLNKVQSVIG